ncbi:HNH endonuclease [Massilia sp. TS11]|uniref:HNH endonuclease n=1 Tax=Massilia sp. TS11 TaxID=2908003 RepID=UPI001EDA322E|nr:HNH endonuclease [Massilia sp. TS11]MCG2586506.1 HNH endonuclease [Massilia sp. TS11]
MCNMHWLRMYRHGSTDRPAKKAKARGTCGVEGCGSEATRVGAGLCEAHYMRVRRHGDSGIKSNLKPGLLEHSGGYLLQHAPEHPLRRTWSRVYQHRVVYHAHHGDGPFACHWCGVQVTWNDMHVDHLDDDPKNNEIGNLVSSCPKCNQKRGLAKLKATMKQKHGITVNGVTKTVIEWAATVKHISRSGIAARLAAGWTPSDAIMTPRRGAR